MHQPRLSRIAQPIILLLITILITGCDGQDEGPDICRLVMIEYEGQGQSGQIRYEYNDDGLLTGMNNISGSTCREHLFYDADEKLVRRTFECGGELMSEGNYDYSTADRVSIINKMHFRNTTTTVVKYFNGDLRADSITELNTLDEPRYYRVRFDYNEAGLVYSEGSERPCCTDFLISDIAYDNGINPYYMLQQAAGTSNEILDDYAFSSIFPQHASANNPVSYTYTRRERLGPDASIILEQEDTPVTISIEYYNGSLYPSKMTRFENGQKNGSSILFYYADCK
jgi:hypothetical protein